MGIRHCVNRYFVRYAIVFARVKSPLGDIMYRFKGEYQIDLKASGVRSGLLWNRVSERVKTYENK